jgi:hypothetical protein
LNTYVIILSCVSLSSKKKVRTTCLAIWIETHGKKSGKPQAESGVCCGHVFVKEVGCQSVLVIAIAVSISSSNSTSALSL